VSIKSTFNFGGIPPFVNQFGVVMAAHDFLLRKSLLQRAGSGRYAVTTTAGEDTSELREAGGKGETDERGAG